MTEKSIVERWNVKNDATGMREVDQQMVIKSIEGSRKDGLWITQFLYRLDFLRPDLCGYHIPKLYSRRIDPDR